MQCPPRPRAGVEGLEAERLALGGIDNLPHVDAEFVVEHLQLVDESDVHCAIGVLEDLAGLGHLQARDTDDLDDGATVHRAREGGARVIEPADDFGDGRGLKQGVPRVFPLRAVGEEIIRSALQACGFEDRPDRHPGRRRDKSCSPGRQAVRDAACLAIDRAVSSI